MNVIREYQVERWGRKVWFVDVQCPCGAVSARPRYARGRQCARCCKPNLRHGRARDGSPDLTYHSWENMKARCNNPRNPYYAKYGGAGITVCPEWRLFDVFLQDMGERPGKGYTLDRIDNTKGYSKENCRWTTRKVQQNNRQCTYFVEWRGERLPLTAFAEKVGAPYDVVYYHLKRGKTTEQIAAHVEKRFVRTASLQF